MSDPAPKKPKKPKRLRMFEYKTEVISGNYFDVTRYMDSHLDILGWELISITADKEMGNYCVCILKRKIT